MAALKHSRQRDAIKYNMKHRKDHPTADMVYADIRKEFPNISLGTVYRNLAVLTEMGEIRKLSFETGGDHYDGNPLPHNHFVCRKCRRVFDLEEDPLEMDHLDPEVLQNFDGKVEECSITYYGVCGECLRENVV